MDGEFPQAAVEPRQVETVIVGSGFGGLGMAVQLLQAGRRDFVVLEKDHEVGGTWRDNTYPGCACDVQSHMYSFSFAPKADWTQRYAPWNEIQQYILDTTEKYGVRPYIEFGQEVNDARFDERTARWHIRTAQGLHLVAKYWVLASGPLHFPATPDIPGLKDFEGEMFHSARWNHEYDFSGKRVVSIGTGGSAIQYVPEIAPKVKQLHVMQRSAAWVIPRDVRKYSAFSKWLFKHIPGARWLHRVRLYWSNESRVWPVFTYRPWLSKLLSGAIKMLIRRKVEDSRVAEQLTPDYAIGCKRVLISNDYYPTFNRDNVELVTDRIQEIRAQSVVTADGIERPADCIILGTGFQVDPRIYMRNFAVVGLGGRRIQEDWKDGAEAYLGIAVHGYPNFFQLVGPNTGLGHNSIIFMIEAQVHYILECMKLMDEKNAGYMDVRSEAQTEFNEEIQAQFPRTVWGTGCASWYNQADGKNIALWPYSTWRYWLRTRKVRAADFDIVPSREQAQALAANSAVHAAP